MQIEDHSCYNVGVLVFASCYVLSLDNVVKGYMVNHTEEEIGEDNKT